jgi:hypothetical protein
MTILVITPKEFIRNLHQYYNKKLVLEDTPFFCVNGLAYPDYVICVGTCGGIKVQYDNNSKFCTLTQNDLAHFQKGITSKRTSIKVFPEGPYALEALSDSINVYKQRITNYDRLLKAAEQKLKHQQAILQNYPELLI